jgi:hypothetical protein
MGVHVNVMTPAVLQKRMLLAFYILVLSYLLLRTFST